MLSAWLVAAGAGVRCAGADAGAADNSPDQVGNSVVKVFATIRRPDPYRPWTKEDPTQVSGSGVVIDGHRILSNAHVVLYASQVEVQANQAGDKIAATVEAIAPGIDLAVLKVADDTFFDAHPPLPRAKTLPNVADAVMAYGYPTGGSGLSITKGIVSRIEFSSYGLGVSGLRIQIDAAINPGNSGGPAVAGGKMIGLAFSRLGGEQNIGYIIPTDEIELFLADIAGGQYKGKPALHDQFQTLENPALRSFLKLDPSVHGMIVHKPASHDAGYPLKEWDVVTDIAGTPVDDQGMVKLEGSQRVRFTYLVQQVATNGKVRLTVVRAAEKRQVDVPVPATRPLLITNLTGSYPSYFICGPLVFSTATMDFVSGLLSSRSSYAVLGLAVEGSPLVKRLEDEPAFAGEGLVVVASPFFPHRLAKGYSSPYAEVVKAVNGAPVRNLDHLVEILRDSTNENITIEFDQHGGETMIFPRREMLDATDEILTDNGVRSQGTPDTLKIWNAKPAK
jgi:S1-C subfamily serine protease